MTRAESCIYIIYITYTVTYIRLYIDIVLYYYEILCSCIEVIFAIDENWGGSGICNGQSLSGLLYDLSMTPPPPCNWPPTGMICGLPHRGRWPQVRVPLNFSQLPARFICLTITCIKLPPTGNESPDTLWLVTSWPLTRKGITLTFPHLRCVWLAISVTSSHAVKTFSVAHWL